MLISGLVAAGGLRRFLAPQPHLDPTTDHTAAALKRMTSRTRAPTSFSNLQSRAGAGAASLREQPERLSQAARSFQRLQRCGADAVQKWRRSELMSEMVGIIEEAAHCELLGVTWASLNGPSRVILSALCCDRPHKVAGCLESAVGSREEAAVNW
mmetsp:Transcript_88912/g.206909  ORF Transcript_88912/g.206909 Transcript_88912/m.206909 type:complete len:155 (-) Transcript_88912:19-483(-)